MKSSERKRNQSAAGFTIMELMVAMAIFLIIGGAALKLVRSHVPLASGQQSQTALNVAMRSAIAQMEIDVANAGTGYYTGVNIPDWPIGVTIVNQPQTTACNNASTLTYGANCFDQLNIISTDPAVLPLHPSSSVAGPVDVDTNTMTNVYLTPPAGFTATTFAALFSPGDELLWLQPGSPRSRITTTNITASIPNGTKTQITFTSTGTGGCGGCSGGYNVSDLYAIANIGDDSDSSNIPLAHNFSAANDWVMKLKPVVYKVDISTPTNPKLVRQSGTATPDVVAEQIIGFRVGASIRSGTTASGTDSPLYSFNAQGDYNSDWTEVRALRVSLIGRTTPSTDPTNTFKNSFDGGPYKIEGVSVTINPRNLSMTDQ